MIERSLWSGIPVSVEFRKILAMLVLAALCFIAGIIVRTGPGLRAKNAVEETLLEKLPGYTLLRGRAGRVAGQGGRTRLCAGALRDRRGTGSGPDRRETGDGSYTIIGLDILSADASDARKED